ncbi:transmembrane protein 80-like [Bradysia coprophila]|uniref:transmembrane protein 80-like n=1 Tax=Bradysia coprophila TaxID=38358 RepID=UPI00187DB6DF|nr:transmembrane protein 80-like [Bradysia coprophila]XP_037037526.1 transmembrane protein 80-like [Bradysia coprophila]
MVNVSLSYEILLYLNSFYFGMFGSCEFAMGVLKAINSSYLKYTPQQLQQDVCILVATLILETIRVYLGRKGSLSEHGWHVIVSVILTIPCGMGTYYLLFIQFMPLKLEAILCGLMLALQISELLYGIIFMFQSCRPTVYT